MTAEVSSIPVLIAYVANMINCRIEKHLTLGPTAKFFLRGFARQDIILALTQQRRNLIPTTSWYDDECKTSVDRFLGLTMPLMPLLEELCAIAADMKLQRGCSGIVDLIAGENHDATAARGLKELDSVSRLEYLKLEIYNWRPTVSSNTRQVPRSFLKSRKYLLQAHAFKLSALLYIHRLCYPVGVASDPDIDASNMAYEILLHCSGEQAEMGLLLWPIFVAACELKSLDDRKLNLELLERNYRCRGTSTSLQVKEFLEKYVWHAIDSETTGWSWLALVEMFSSDFAPL
jgi:hypothetical protein